MVPALLSSGRLTPGFLTHSYLDSPGFAFIRARSDDRCCLPTTKTVKMNTKCPVSASDDAYCISWVLREPHILSHVPAIVNVVA